jgi:hypothetical protein
MGRVRDVAAFPGARRAASHERLYQIHHILTGPGGSPSRSFKSLTIEYPGRARGSRLVVECPPVFALTGRWPARPRPSCRLACFSVTSSRTSGRPFLPTLCRNKKKTTSPHAGQVGLGRTRGPGSQRSSVTRPEPIRNPRSVYCKNQPSSTSNGLRRRSRHPCPGPAPGRPSLVMHQAGPNRRRRPERRRDHPAKTQHPAVEWEGRSSGR